MPVVKLGRPGSRSLALRAAATNCARCGKIAPRCDECLAQLVSAHRDWAAAFGRQWGRFVPLSRTAPRWDNAADHALALRMVKALRLDDDRAREALAQVWIEAGAAHLRARHQRRAAAEPPQIAPEVVQPTGGWLITLNGRPYTRAYAFGAVAFWVHRRRSNGRWAVFVTGEGAPLVLPLNVTREQFASAVGRRGAYRLIPVDVGGERVTASPAVITL